MKKKINMEKSLENAKVWLKEIFLIVKKELRANFTSPMAYIVMAVFLAILEFLYFTTLFSIQLVYITPLLDNVPWLFLFLIPAITMASFSQEKKEGTIEFYLTQPISEVQLLVGKFLSNYIFVIISTLLTLPAIISVASYGDVDWGQILAQYLGVFSLAFVLTSIGTLMSSLVKNQISAFLLSVITSFGLTIIGLDIITQALPTTIANILERVGIYSHYTALSKGALDFRDLIYFFSIGTVFLLTSYIPLIKNKFNKKEPIYNSLKAIIILLSALAFSVAFLGEQIPGRIDLTQNKIYTLSQTTVDILENVEDVINITVYESQNLPSQWQAQSRDIEEMLADYDIYGKENVIVTYKYTEDEEVEEEALAAGIQAMQFNTQEADEISVKKGYLGLEIAYLDETEVISFVESTSDLEYQLTKRINKLTVEDKPNVVFWNDKITHSIYSDYTVMYEVLLDQFNVSTYIYSEEEPNLPEETDVLVIAGPTEEFTEEEKNIITNYINEGGSVFALIDSVVIDETTLTASVNEYSLSDIFTQYGITVKDELIFDKEYSEIVSVGSGYSQYLAQYPFWIQTEPSADSWITQDLDLTTLRWASPIEITEAEDSVIETLLASSNYSATQNEETFDVMLGSTLSQTQEETYSRPVAVSYQKELDEETKIRLIVVGDSDMLSDSSVEANGYAAMFGLNTIEWLTQANSLNEIRQKNRDLSPLVFEEDWQATLLQYGNIIGIIALVSGTGVFIIVRRNKRSRRKYE